MEKYINNNKKLIISHISDNDGIGAVILAKLAFKDIDYLLIEIKEQNEIIPFIEQTNYEQIYICDLGLTDEIGLWLNELDQSVLLFDHHITSIALDQYDYATVKVEYQGQKTCGTHLFYRYLVDNNLLKSTLALETFVECTRAIDTWEWEKSQNLLASDLNLLFKMIGPLAYLNSFDEILNNQEAFVFTKEQQIVVDLAKKDLADYLKACSKAMLITKVEGLKAGIIFSERYTSHLGNYLCTNKPIDFIILIDMIRETVSLRSIGEVNVSVIAQKYGGGGHKNAAGFCLTKENKLIFLDLIIQTIAQQ